MTDQQFNILMDRLDDLQRQISEIVGGGVRREVLDVILSPDPLAALKEQNKARRRQPAKRRKGGV